MGRNFPDWIAACVDANNDDELPKPFVLWSAISAVAGALGRKNWYDHGSYKVRPNLFVILVARPGVMKTVAMKLPFEEVFNLLTEPMPGDSSGIEREIEAARLRWPQYIRGKDAQPLRLIKGKITYQELVKEISVISKPRLEFVEAPFDGSVTIRTNEFGTFMSRNSEDLQILLTEAWDAGDEYEYRTKHQGVDIVRGLCINWIAAATPQQFVANLPANIVEQGLLSRIIPVYHEAPARKKRKIRAARHDKKLMEQLAKDLGDIAAMSGEWNWDQETEVVVEEWLQTEAPLPKDPMMQEYNTRRFSHLRALCMCFAAGRARRNIIKLEDWNSATATLFDAETKMPHILRRFGMSEGGKFADDLVTFVLERGGHCSYEALTREGMRIMRSAPEMVAAIAMLFDTNQLHREGDLVTTNEGTRT